MLTRQEIEGVLQEIYQTQKVNKGVEISLEANPDDGYRKAGINRLSIGIQSFFDEHLQWMNRAHSAGQARDCILRAQDEGIHNITVDLIYGIPGMTNETWQKNLKLFFATGVPHLSAYSLTVEKNTALEKKIRKGEYKTTDDEESAGHFELLMDEMEARGWLHYEVSNFAASVSTISKHNSAYWKNQKYLGLGPSAHSYNGQERRRNISPMNRYLEAVEGDSVFYETELLGDKERYNEKVLTGLRTMWGVNAGELESFKEYFEKGARQFVNRGMMEVNGNVYVLTDKGKMLADHIAAELFYSDH